MKGEAGHEVILRGCGPAKRTRATATRRVFWEDLDVAE